MATKPFMDLTQEELEAMTPQQRMWESLDYTYGRQVDRSNQDFAKAYSTASNQLLNRGMQRSSYGAQTLANLQKQGIEAANDLRGQQNAAYAGQLYQIGRDAEADRQHDQQVAMQYLSMIKDNGGTPSADLLKQAGLSMADWNAMVQQVGGGEYVAPAPSGGGGSYKPKATTTPGDTGATNDANWISLVTGDSRNGVKPATNTSVLNSGANKALVQSIASMNKTSTPMTVSAAQKILSPASAKPATITNSSAFAKAMSTINKKLGGK